MYIHRYSIAFGLVLALALTFLIPDQGLAQEQEKIQLIDQISGKALIYAHFVYGAQKGISDQDGFITLQYLPGQNLLISHVEMGKIRISAPQLDQAFRDNKLNLAKGNPIQLQPVTVMGLRNRQPDHLVTMSDHDKLSHDAGAVLEQLPAISVIKKSASYGWDPVLRGFKYDQLNLVIDGLQTANAACPNRMDPPASQIPLNQIQKVEVIKGPHALRYGPSFGGTINFITSPPTFGPLKPVSRLSTSYESNGNIFRTEGLIGLQSEAVNFSLNGAWSQGNDYQDGVGNEVPAEFKKGSFGTNLNWKIKPNQLVSLSATRNLARDIEFAALPMDLVSDDTWLLRAGYEVNYQDQLISDWKTSVFYTSVDHLMDNLGKPMDPRTVNAVTPAQTTTFGGRTETKLQYSHAYLYLGADVRVETANGTRTREMLMGPMAGKIFEDNVWQEGKISRSGIFGEYHLIMNQINLVFSGRLDVNTASIKDQAEEFGQNYATTSETQYNPHLSAGMQADLSDQFHFGVWLGRSQRSGNMSERYINYFPVGLDPYELIGNPNLDPEINNQIDINLGFEAKKARIELNYFAAYLQNFITSEIQSELTPRLPKSPGVRQFVNLEEAFMTGFELSYQQSWNQYLQHHLSLAYTYGKDLSRADPLPEIPPFDARFSISGSFFKDKLKPLASLRHVFEQDRISSIYGETTTPAFSLVDLKTTYALSDKISAAAGINNLFDEAYYEHLTRAVLGRENAIYAPGRNFYITLSYEMMN
ncbi:MAG: TonB-dependent receptor domain-containing protein [Candidatus Cyclobacteriaceae bacterium M3_2C_046]